MARLIVVSNRLPKMRPVERTGELEVPAGGLASAVLATLRRYPRSLWFGWSGNVEARRRTRRVSHQVVSGLELVGASLTQGEVADYYHGFCNMVLWPICHCFQDRVLIALKQEASYRQVQARFADRLLPLLSAGDRIWVHDYHLLLLGRELRRRGWRGRIGFFLHVPFPSHDLWKLLPDPRGFLEAMLDYDLVGFQVPSYLDNYLSCCRRELGARWDGARLVSGSAVQRVGVYPVSIEPSDFLPPAGRPLRPERKGELGRVVRGRRLILGVDRLDYSKGVPDRIRAFEQLIRRHPEWKNKVSYIQIGSPTRAAAAQYRKERRLVESLVGRVNGELAEHNWVPIRYLYRTYPRSTLARFYREAAVGLVTPLRDGMNLVAKEFVAAQNPTSPGVLVLSRCAGAAEDLPEALIVNPYIPAEVAEGIARALVMPLPERSERHRALLDRIRSHTVTDWGRRFLEDLESCPARQQVRETIRARAVRSPRGAGAGRAGGWLG